MYLPGSFFAVQVFNGDGRQNGTQFGQSSVVFVSSPVGNHYRVVALPFYCVAEGVE